MAEQAKGCHHCIGTAYTVTNLVFNFIHTRAVANDGLSPREISELRLRFLESFSSGFDFFEAIHRDCMNASRDTLPAPFSRDMILPSLLSTCGRRSAATAFRLQIRLYGLEWLDDFFFALAIYIREHIRPYAEPQLIAAFVEAAGKYKSNLTATKLLAEAKSEAVMVRCIAALTQSAERSSRAQQICDVVNKYIMNTRNITGANPANTTREEVEQFLQRLSGEAKLVVDAADRTGSV